MFCPECRCEYRAGFTRCASCNVDLVADLATPDRPAADTSPAPVEVRRISMGDYCGFLSVDDARQARNRLWSYGIPSEIAIRLKPEAQAPTPEQEEFWLRVPLSDRRGVMEILGYDEVASEKDSFSCSDCGKTVAADESFCPHCGARFE